MTTTYIVQSGNLFKIGSTRNWKQRRSAIVRDYGPVSDVLVMHGEKSRERELQAEFMEYNINYRSNGRWRRCDWFKNIPFANSVLCATRT